MTNAWPQTCNYCGAPLIGGHRCPRCDYRRPKVDEIKYSGLTEVGGGGGGASRPPFNPDIVFTGSGQAIDENFGAGTIIVPGIDVPATGALLVGISLSAGTTLNSVKWGAGLVDLTLIESHVRAASQSATLLYGLLGEVGGGNGSLVVDVGSNALAAAVVTFTVSMAAPAPTIDGTAESEGFSATPTVGPLTTTDGHDMLVAVIGDVGPEGDTAGTWTDSFTRIGRVGNTTSTGLETTVDVATRVVNVTGSFTTGKTGMTSRPWAAVMAGVKGP